MAGSDVFHKLFLRPENPRTLCPPHLLHNSSLLLNLFYFFSTFLLDVSEFSSWRVIFEIFVRFFSRTKVSFSLFKSRSKQKAFGNFNSFLPQHVISQCLFYSHFIYVPGYTSALLAFWHPCATVLLQEKLLAVDNLSP